MDKSTPFTHPPDNYKEGQCYTCRAKDEQIKNLQESLEEMDELLQCAREDSTYWEELYYDELSRNIE